MEAGEIFAKIRANAKQFKATMEAVKKEVKSTGEYIKKNEDNFKSLGTVAGIAFAGISFGVKKATDESKEYYKSMLSLRSVAESKGFLGAEKAIEEMEVVRKGFLTVQEAAISTANLIKKDFTLDEAIESVEKITAISYTNKQAHLSLGQAVKSTTEGFKNELSTLADAGGITKNISDIYEDFGKTIGKTAKQLTEREKALAIMSQVEKEAVIYGNNLNEALKNLSGTEAQLNAETKKLSREFGEAMEPTLKSIYERIIPIVEVIGEWIGDHPKLTAIITSSVMVITSLVAILSTAAIIIPKIITGIKELGIASAVTSGQIKIAQVTTSGWYSVLAANPMVAVAGAIAVVTAGIWAYNKAQEVARKRTIEKAQAAIQEQNEINNLVEDYERLRTKTKLNVTEKDELERVTKRLKDLVPTLATEIDKETDAYDRQISKVKELAFTKNESLLESAALAAEVELPGLEDDLKKAKETVEKYRTYLDSEVEGEYSPFLGIKIFDEDDQKKSLSRALSRKGEIEQQIQKYEQTIKAYEKFKNKSNEAIKEPKKNRTANLDTRSSAKSSKTMEDIVNKEINLIELSNRAKEISDLEYYRKLKGLQIKYSSFFNKNEEARLNFKIRTNQALENIEDETMRAKEKAYEKAYNSSINWIEKEIYYNRLSAQEQIEAWGRVKKKAEEGIYGPDNKAEIVERANKEIFKVRKEYLDKWYKSETDKIKRIENEELESLDRRQKEYNEKHQKRLEMLDKETNTAIEEKQKELREIDRLARRQDYNREQSGLRDELSKKQSEYDIYKDSVTDRGKEKANSLLEDINDIREKIQRNESQRERELRKRSIKDEIEDIKERAKSKKEKLQEEYETKIEFFNKERESIKTHYEDMRDSLNSYMEKTKSSLDNFTKSNENTIINSLNNLSNRYSQINEGFMSAIEKQSEAFKININETVDNIKNKVQEALSATKKLSLDNGVMVDINSIPRTSNNNITKNTYITNNNSVNDYGSKIINKEADIDNYTSTLGSKFKDMERGESNVG